MLCSYNDITNWFWFVSLRYPTAIYESGNTLRGNLYEKNSTPKIFSNSSEKEFNEDGTRKNIFAVLLSNCPDNDSKLPAAILLHDSGSAKFKLRDQFL